MPVILKRLQPQVEVINCSIFVYINVVDCIVKRDRISVTGIKFRNKLFRCYGRKHKNANKHICPSAKSGSNVFYYLFQLLNNLYELLAKTY